MLNWNYFFPRTWHSIRKVINLGCFTGLLSDHGHFSVWRSIPISKILVVTTVCPRCSDPLYIVIYYMKWVTSWTHSTTHRSMFALSTIKKNITWRLGWHMLGWSWKVLCQRISLLNNLYFAIITGVTKGS